MREIVHIQVGGSGNEIGCKLWQAIGRDHGLDATGKYVGTFPRQLEQIEVYYKNAPSGRYLPRAIMADLEPETINNKCMESDGAIFPLANRIMGNTGAGNNWAKGHYTEGAELIDDLLESIRDEAEAADHLQGFQLVHGIGGGTGGGLGTLLMQKLSEEYPGEVRMSFSLLPEPGCCTIVEPYNISLSLLHLTESVEEVILMENQALYDICFRELKLPTHQYSDLNALIVPVLAATTSSLRFRCEVNGTLRQQVMNMVPFERLHFLVPSYEPWVSRGFNECSNVSVPTLAQQLFEARHPVCRHPPSRGKYLCACATFRGAVGAAEVDHAMARQVNFHAESFVDWIPDNAKWVACDVPLSGIARNAILLANSTAIRETFLRVEEQLNALLNRKAFLHHYTGEGMDESEFTQAQDNLRDLAAQYQLYETVADDELELEDSSAEGKQAAPLTSHS